VKAMATQKQILANIENAKLSTGPKTETGKALIAQNAIKHGIFSKQIVLKEESVDEFEQLKKEFYSQFQPQGLLEKLFLERALTAAWRLSRMMQIESILMNYATKKSFGRGLADVLSGRQGDELSLLCRYETSLEKILFRSLTELRDLQSTRTSHAEIEIGFVSQNCIEEVDEN
jgi:hypothetical protein